MAGVATRPADVLLRRLGWPLVIGGPIAALGILLLRPEWDPAMPAPIPHFFIVTLTALLALVMAGFVAVAARQFRDAQLFLLALAFTAIAGIFLTHALTTPGALVGPNLWIGRTARLSLLVGALLLALSTIHLPERVRRWINEWQGRIFLSLLFGCLALLAVAVATSPSATQTGAGVAMAAHLDYDAPAPSGTAAHDAGAMPIDPLAQDPPWLPAAMTAATLTCLGVAGLRYYPLYRRAQLPLRAGVLLSIILLAQAELSMSLATTWRLSWWGYHVAMLLAFITLLGGLIWEYSRGRSLEGVLEGVLLRGTIDQIERDYAEVIVALVEAVEAKDPYTRGHTTRVAQLSTLIAEELGLPAAETRTVRQAALLHDIGKIAVPDAILNKPGPLTDEEFAVVKEHPVRGYRMLQKVRSLRREGAGVRYHHERLDGSGYPDGLRGEAIPLDARIIAVADVFDALTSARAYRAPWSRERALAYLRQEAGVRLDAACVEALVRALARRDPSLPQLMIAETS